jgi:hypothetical protein
MHRDPRIAKLFGLSARRKTQVWFSSQMAAAFQAIEMEAEKSLGNFARSLSKEPGRPLQSVCVCA